MRRGSDAPVKNMHHPTKGMKKLLSLEMNLKLRFR